jgi:hypothetical protein
MEEDCGEGQGLSWAVEPRRERERESNKSTAQLSLNSVYSTRLVSVKIRNHITNGGPIEQMMARRGDLELNVRSEPRCGHHLHSR